MCICTYNYDMMKRKFVQIKRTHKAKRVIACANVQKQL